MSSKFILWLAKELPQCDLCSNMAKYDAKIRDGAWAYLCPAHFAKYGVGLGLGKGQQLIAPFGAQEGKNGKI